MSAPGTSGDLFAVARQHPDQAAADGAGADEGDLDGFQWEPDEAPACAGVIEVSVVTGRGRGDETGVER